MITILTYSYLCLVPIESFSSVETDRYREVPASQISHILISLGVYTVDILFVLHPCERPVHALYPEAIFTLQIYRKPSIAHNHSDCVLGKIPTRGKHRLCTVSGCLLCGDRWSSGAAAAALLMWSTRCAICVDSTLITACILD